MPECFVRRVLVCFLAVREEMLLAGGPNMCQACMIARPVSDTTRRTINYELKIRGHLPVSIIFLSTKYVASASGAVGDVARRSPRGGAWAWRA